MKRIYRPILALVLVMGFSFTSCEKRTDDNPRDTTTVSTTHDSTLITAQQGKGTGVIKALDLKSHSITLAHNDIPGLMGAMTMIYTLDSSASLHGAKSGDSVSFTLTSSAAGEFVVTSVSPIAHK